MRVVCDGVATNAERDALAAEGCDLMTGPLFVAGHQAPAPRAL